MEIKSQYIDALCKEMALRKDYLNSETVETVYFGGGTPSQLDASDFEKLFSSLHQSGFNLKTTEVTLEANPDDISKTYLESIRKAPFNRISLGVQSFDDSELRFLNRRHDAQTAINAVKLCQEAGFDNISIDLIYGIRYPSVRDVWQDSLKQALDLNVQHISAYSLTYEEGTELFRMVEDGKISPVDDDLSISMYELLVDRLVQNGFEQYEISNFAKPGCRSRHNSSYWNGTHYLGLGASAHSYNGQSRQWNVSSLKGYIDSIQGGEIPAEMEVITPPIAHNDYIITRLRTKEGINPDELAKLFGEKAKERCLKLGDSYIKEGMLVLEDNILKITYKGISISDSIMRDLLL
jgi:oxygen-independent coproporphyrinogen-3 oxidase